MTKRILITGGAGFIGSNTVDQLLEDGKEVVVLDNLSSGKLTNLNLKHTNLEFIEGDVLEFPYLLDLISTCDAVLHLAAIASVPQSLSNPIYTFQVNTQGFLHVLEAIRQAKRNIRLVYASSAAVYGNAVELPCSDELPLTNFPMSPYALQKIHDENYADLYARINDVRSLGLRYFNVYGNRQDPQSVYSGVISRFINTFKIDEPFTIFGNGQQSRDFIFIDDVVRANCLALESEYTGILNIATGDAKSLLTMIKYAEEIKGKKAELQFSSPRPGDIHSSYASTYLAERMLNFHADIDLKTGMSQLLDIL